MRTTTLHLRARSASRFRLALPLLSALTALILAGGCAGSRVPAADITAPPSLARVKLPEAGTDPHMIDVRALASPDFATRAQAASRLLEAGEEALPALGRAGDLMVPVPGGVQVSATRSVVEAILADVDGQRLEEHLGSPWAGVRRAAAVQIGERDHWVAVPRLIERLDDDAPAVREASAGSLRRLTNQWFGFQATAAVGGRRAAAERWRAWWSREGRVARDDPGPSAALVDAGR